MIVVLAALTMAAPAAAQNPHEHSRPVPSGATVTSVDTITAGRFRNGSCRWQDVSRRARQGSYPYVSWANDSTCTAVVYNLEQRTVPAPRTPPYFRGNPERPEELKFQKDSAAKRDSVKPKVP